MENLIVVKEIRDEIEKLLSITQGFIMKDLPAHNIEKGLFTQLLALGLVVLKYIFDQKAEQLKGYRPNQMECEKLLSKGEKQRNYLSLFGLLSLSRMRYWSIERGTYYELDEQLSLPQSTCWSYNLQKLVGENASENDYQESVRILNELLSLNLSGKSSQRNVEHLGPYIDAFYEQKVVEAESEAVCFSASFDGKGVPKITKKSTKSGNPKARLKPGEKTGVKQMATVSVTSHFTPKKRTKASVIHALMNDPSISKISKGEMRKVPKENDNRWHKKIHRRAFLNDQLKAVEYGLDDIRRRMSHPNSKFVIPIDAGIGLEEKVLAYVKKHQLETQFDGIILDIIHVVEYVWDAANAIFGGKSEVRSPWVRAVLEDLLDSETAKVIKDLEEIRDRTELTANRTQQLNTTITYFTNHQHKMDFKKFIEKGYPVSSALVESACGHLVKERMEQTGMRWSTEGAQYMMDLRAVKQNKDVKEFMEFVIKKERADFMKVAA